VAWRRSSLAITVGRGGPLPRVSGSGHSTALLPSFVGLFLWNPAIVRFPLRYAWFWIPFVFIMIPTGSVATMLFLASSVAGTQHERWVGHRFTWLVTAFATAFIAIEVVPIAWPLVAPLHTR